MNEKRLKKYEYLSSKIRTQFFIILVITPLTNNLKSQLAYCTFGCLKKLATF